MEICRLRGRRVAFDRAVLAVLLCGRRLQDAAAEPRDGALSSLPSLPTVIWRAILDFLPSWWWPGKDTQRIAAGCRSSVLLDGVPWHWGCPRDAPSFVPIPVSGFHRAEVVEVCAGDAFFLARTQNGMLYLWGSRQIGEPDESTGSRKVQLQRRHSGHQKPQVVLGSLCDGSAPVPLSGVAHVAAGYDHALCLLRDCSTVLALGNVAYGKSGGCPWRQRSEGEDNAFVGVAYPVSGLGKAEASIVGVICGVHHSHVLCENGDVWAWGLHHRGGRTMTRPCAMPRQVEYGAVHHGRIISLAAGEGFSVAVTARGRVLSWGLSKVAEAGRQVSKTTSASAFIQKKRSGLPPAVLCLPALRPLEVPITAVAGKNHALVLTSLGALLAMGDHLIRPPRALMLDDDPQMGAELCLAPRTSIDNAIAHVLIPAKCVDSVRSMSGPQCTRVLELSAFRHTLFRLEDGRVVSFGYGEAGQLGYARTLESETRQSDRCLSHELRVRRADGYYCAQREVGWRRTSWIVEEAELGSCHVHKFS